MPPRQVKRSYTARGETARHYKMRENMLDDLESIAASGDGGLPAHAIDGRRREGLIDRKMISLCCDNKIRATQHGFEVIKFLREEMSRRMTPSARPEIA